MTNARAIVVMGVSGCGKTSVAEGLAAAFSAAFIEGDSLHPAENVEKMSKGIPLDDTDRWPWLAIIGDALSDALSQDKSIVISCSALKKTYRDRLRDAAGGKLAFVFLNGSRELLLSRMSARRGHFMPASLLDSQLATLENPRGEPGVITVDIDAPIERIVAAALHGLAAQTLGGRAMKHFLNRREDIVTEALDGLLMTAPEGTLARLDTYPDIKVILRADWAKDRVAVVSGGGAGHEPSHAGFVGRGMLTAAVSGEIFASPSVDAVLTAIRAVTGEAGCLLVVKNYTGDRLNFGLAAERARAEGFKVEMVIVADDIALPDLPQPRGVAGTLFVHKIAGHLAETGENLETIATAARAAAGDILSLGMSLSSCSIPGQAHEERLGPDEGELGLGIHGEPGVERIAIDSARSLVATMVERLAGRMAGEGSYALLINNLGAVPPLEMGVVTNAVLSSPLASRIRLVIGPAPLMTALNMNGFSLSLIKLDPGREAALCVEVAPRAWVSPVVQKPITILPRPAFAIAEAPAASADAGTESAIRTVCATLVALEADLNRLDARAGDGDTGSTAAAGARSIESRIATLPLADLAATFGVIGATLGTSMGGSSGVLLSIFFTAAGQALGKGAPSAEALLAGLDRMTFYGGAKPGDRTMIDALDPALRALASGSLADAAKAARTGADATKRMTKAKAGRAAYIGERDLDGVADPGAEAVAAVFEALAVLPAA